VSEKLKNFASNFADW